MFGLRNSLVKHMRFFLLRLETYIKQGVATIF
jgi:hypothetical protein